MKKGFTLIELLIVIGILAILATATILVLNPAQLFAQARDSQRISDLSALKSALGFYLATAATPDLDAAGGTCAANYWASVTPAARRLTGALNVDQSANVALTVGGAGWVPVDFSGASGGAPLSSLPKDPTNATVGGVEYNYQYGCDSTNRWFEIDAKMESTRYSNGGTNDVESTDGGLTAAVYEVGNDPGLDL
ncbi:MAG: type II secretion system protein [bacterium]|nr:type II secretion system protein [bacterium]